MDDNTYHYFFKQSSSMATSSTLPKESTLEAKKESNKDKNGI